ncbi:hypothetical protein L6164_014463 [Bauhinia variegata]|uniref:Uncharacterized protein n=1 Tax=Bauhinia variegata TaxID=167791 RepID=A0ACB9NHJ8_BAUVA|nr:hypothetical protein L6164_014463 [Bauhinia variegata]
MDMNEAEEVRELPYNTASTHHHLQNMYPTQKPIVTSSLTNNMERGEGSEGHHVLAHLGSSQPPHCIPFDYSQLHSSNTPIQISGHRFSPKTSSHSDNNNFDEAKLLLDDRKKKRMYSNRESARRSRMRKKQQIQALQYQVENLQTMNHQLSQKIIYLLECNQQILQQNAQLKEKVSSLQLALSELLVPLSHVEEANHISNAIMPEPSARPVTTSGV